MTIPAPLISGSIAYLVLGAVLIALSLGSLATGMQTKDNVAWVLNMASHDAFLPIVDAFPWTKKLQLHDYDYSFLHCFVPCFFIVKHRQCRHYNCYLFNVALLVSSKKVLIYPASVFWTATSVIGYRENGIYKTYYNTLYTIGSICGNLCINYSHHEATKTRYEAHLHFFHDWSCRILHVFAHESLHCILFLGSALGCINGIHSSNQSTKFKNIGIRKGLEVNFTTDGTESLSQFSLM